jgi:DNA-directed RNA polymerase specialized sigma24 family protein
MWGIMPEGKNRATEILLGPDGERIWLLLVDYAAKLARWYGWRTGKILPGGLSPDGIAKDVIIKVLEGKRKWDPEREPSLLTALRGMVHSYLGHLYSGYEARMIEPIDRPLSDKFERTADSFPICDPNPEQSLLQSELSRLEMTAFNLMLEAVESRGNADLQAVFLALYYADSPKDIADMTGLPIESVYSLGRELDRIAAKISPARVARAMKERTVHE